MGRIERKDVREEGKVGPGTLSSRELWKGLGGGEVRCGFKRSPFAAVQGKKWVTCRMKWLWKGLGVELERGVRLDWEEEEGIGLVGFGGGLRGVEG